METAAQRLKFARKLRGLNQVQLAGKAGVATGTVGNIEAGTRGIQGSALKLAKALAVDPNWLADGEGEAPTSSKSAPTPNPPPAPTNAQGIAPVADTEALLVPTLAQALQVLLDAIAESPHRAELRQLLPMLVDTNAPAYRQRLGELLAPPMLTPPPAVESKDFFPPVPSPAFNKTKQST